MTILARVTVNLTGWSGAPGVNVLHFSQGSTTWSNEAIYSMCDEIVGMHETLKSWWVPGVQAQLRPEVDMIDSETGNITDQITPSPTFGAITSSGTGGQENRATQALFRFKGDRWKNGRRFAGRMFFGPLSSSVLGSDGLLTAGSIDDGQDAFTAMISGLGTRLAIYSRPNSATNTPGDWADVTSVQVAPTPAVLRSRRD